MVSPEEYEHARQLLSNAINEAYEGVYLVPPVELAPGYWALWPHRDVRINLEETRMWSYGKPMGGTGNLQAHITWPYMQSNRVKPLPIGSRFDEDTAIRAAEIARRVSDARMTHYKLESPLAQKAYLAAYNLVEEASPEDRRELWDLWERTRAGDFRIFHKATKAFLRIGSHKRGVLDWMPDEDAEHGRWGVFYKSMGHDKLYSAAQSAVMDALDDWAVSEGLDIVNRN